VGADAFYDGMKQLGILSKTGIDIPGEASTIMHKKETIGPVELATMSFGQSFQITPMQLAATVSSIINGGIRITPHFAKEIRDEEGSLVKQFDYGSGERIVSEETSATMRELLESVVAEGGGSKGQVAGYRIGGKTATSQTLPRSAKQYISSFVAFAPANDPKVLGLVIIAKPTGVYYGGTIAAPVLQRIFENILPYLGIETVESSI
jgi:stage V sporulation protein D (sporulation-specific penicillin-binding protein)